MTHHPQNNTNIFSREKNHLEGEAGFLYFLWYGNIASKKYKTLFMELLETCGLLG